MMSATVDMFPDSTEIERRVLKFIHERKSQDDEFYKKCLTSVLQWGKMQSYSKLNIFGEKAICGCQVRKCFYGDGSLFNFLSRSIIK